MKNSQEKVTDSHNCRIKFLRQRDIKDLFKPVAAASLCQGPQEGAKTCPAAGRAGGHCEELPGGVASCSGLSDSSRPLPQPQEGATTCSAAGWAGGHCEELPGGIASCSDLPSSSSLCQSLQEGATTCPADSRGRGKS